MKKTKLTAIMLSALALMLLFVACAKIYTVTFDPNGGSILSGEGVQTVEEGQSATPPTPERHGYVFDGWEGSWEAVTADASVRAKWIPAYNVKFDTDGGISADTSLLTQIVRQGEAAVLPEVSREGYEFDGWDTDVSCVTYDVTVKAKWLRIYEVTYILAGGTASNDDLITQTILAGEQPTAPRVTRDKYFFKEWSESIDEQNGKITYTAVWERKVYSANEISKLASAATAEVTTYRRNNVELALGSGFFINDSGVLLTNYHVVEGAYAIKVKLGTIIYTATKVLGYNEKKDVAYIQVNTLGKSLPYLSLSEEQPQVGETVYAVGSSLGLTGTFSSGIVSYVDREVDGVKFIQTTAPISSGNSGGPLINQYGEVIGMNTATYTAGQNLNLSVAVREINSVSSKNPIAMETFFNITTPIKYLIGEIVEKHYDIPYMYPDGTYADDDITIHECENGTTYKGVLNKSDTDNFETKVSSKDGVVMIMIRVDDYHDFNKFDIQVRASKELSSGERRNVGITNSNMVITYTSDENGRGMMVAIIDVPDDKYNDGVIYYGFTLCDATEKINYEYFSYAMTAAEYKKFSESNE